MCICDTAYPRKLAFSYLDELSKEFQRSYEGKIDTVTRPYAFMGFGACFMEAQGTGNAHNRHFHLEDDTTVSRLEEFDAGRWAGFCSSKSAGPTQRQPQRCHTDHDEKYGRFALARRQLGP